MTDDTAPVERRTHLCPGSGRLISNRQLGRGRDTCTDCGRFVPIYVNPDGTRLQRHERDFDRHTPYDDDGVTYCGWATELGVFDGCGNLWPCAGRLAGDAS